MTERETAFDVAVKSRRNFDYRGRADLTDHPIRATLVLIQGIFNDAFEGAAVSPHPPLYFDYLDSDIPNATAFSDAAYSFVGITLPLVGTVTRVSAALSASDDVIARLGVAREADRLRIQGALLWMMLTFIVMHEFAHHARGHGGSSLDFEEIRSGSLFGSVQRQAREADADAGAAHFSMAYWFDSPKGREIISEALQIAHVSTDAQDQVVFSCFFAAIAGYTFLREPDSLDKDSAYRRTHPPQLLRFRLLTDVARKWASKSRPALYEWMTEDRYGALLDAVASVVSKTSEYAAGWFAQAAFLRTPEGAAYVEAVDAAIDADHA